LVVCRMFGVDALGIVTDSWVQLAIPANPPSARDSMSAVVNVINNTMVLFGGKDSSSTFNNISLFSLETDTWALAAPAGTLPQKRYAHSAVVSAQNMMVVFGGRNQTTFFNDIAVYDLVANKWVLKSISGSAPKARAGHTAVVDNTGTQMVIFGGVDVDGVFLNDVTFFDLTTFSWFSQPSNGTTTRRAYHSAVVSPFNIMIVFGGSTSSETLGDTVCYSLTTLSWFACSSDTNPNARSSHTAVTSALHLMTIFGGKDGAGNELADVWSFNMYTYTWQEASPSGVGMSSRYAHAAVGTPFGTMILFGGTSSGTESNDFAKYSLVSTVLKNANDGAVLVVLISLIGTLLISMCFAMDYMQEQNAIEKEEAIEHAKSQVARLLPKIPLGPKAQRFLDDFKVSLEIWHVLLPLPFQ